MENKFEDLNIVIKERWINHDGKLKEICSLLLEEIKIKIMKKGQNS